MTQQTTAITASENTLLGITHTTTMRKGISTESCTNLSLQRVVAEEAAHECARDRSVGVRVAALCHEVADGRHEATARTDMWYTTPPPP